MVKDGTLGIEIDVKFSKRVASQLKVKGLISDKLLFYCGLPIVVFTARFGEAGALSIIPVRGDWGRIRGRRYEL